MKNGLTEQLVPLVDDLSKAVKKAQRRGHTEDWHRLRTTSRRLRGALIAFAPALEPELHHWLAKRAKRITKLPTEVRDLDVALENVAMLASHARSPGERHAAEDMRRRLEQKRARRARALQRQLRRDEPTARLRAAVRKAIRRGPGGGEDLLAPSPQALEACARAVLDRRAEVHGWRDDGPLHGLRVAVKKYRGALMALADATPENFDQGAALAALQRVQQVLGEHHDWSELGRRLKKRRATVAEDNTRETAKGARTVAGYRALAARAAREQRARYEVYRRDLSDDVPRLVSVHRAAHRLYAVPIKRAESLVGSA